MLEREKLFSLWNMVLEQLAIEKEKARLMDIHLDDVKTQSQNIILTLYFVFFVFTYKFNSLFPGGKRKTRRNEFLQAKAPVSHG